MQNLYVTMDYVKVIRQIISGDWDTDRQVNLHTNSTIHIHKNAEKGKIEWKKQRQEKKY